MADFFQLVSTLREHMSAKLSRSDALRPLAWLIGLLALVFVGALHEKAESWILVVLLVSIFLAVLLYAGAYIYFLANDRDALRSETYSLNKMAIQSGLYGDSRIGLVEPEVPKGGRAIATIDSVATPENKS